MERGEKKEITFVLEDGNNLQVRKTIVFNGDHYETDLSLQVKRGDQAIPQVKITVGPSIGDQGVSYHTFYSVAPEAVAFIGDKLERHLASRDQWQQQQSRSAHAEWSNGLGRRC